MHNQLTRQSSEGLIDRGTFLPQPSLGDILQKGELAVRIAVFGVAAAGAGLWCAAVAFSPHAAATPLRTGGPACTNQLSGLDGPAAVTAPAAGSPTCAQTGLAAPAAAAPPVPMALPGPLPAAGGPPVPPGAPVPAAPIAPAAPAPAGVPAPAAGAPLLQMAGAGKGVPTNPGPALTTFPVILPGPPPAPAS